MADIDSKRLQELSEARGAILSRLGALQKSKAEIEELLKTFPPMPHDGTLVLGCKSPRYQCPVRLGV